VVLRGGEDRLSEAVRHDARENASDLLAARARSGGRGKSAVDGDDRAGDLTPRVGGQQEQWSNELLGASDSIDGRLLMAELKKCGDPETTVGHLAREPSGGHRVNPHAPGGPRPTPCSWPSRPAAGVRVESEWHLRHGMDLGAVRTHPLGLAGGVLARSHKRAAKRQQDDADKHPHRWERPLLGHLVPPSRWTCAPVVPPYYGWVKWTAAWRCVSQAADGSPRQDSNLRHQV
jgi:hypothetical protein